MSPQLAELDRRLRALSDQERHFIRYALWVESCGYLTRKQKQANLAGLRVYATQENLGRAFTEWVNEIFFRL